MRIGTRGSALALWQARAVAHQLEAAGGPACEIVVIRTSGDESAGRDGAPANLKRAFVKEIEEALLDGRIELAVHSSKDLPAIIPDGLRLGAALAREDPRDALVMPAQAPARGLDAVLSALGDAPRIGTGSVRRAAELRRVRPAGRFVPIRGNVDTRLRKLDDGACDVVVLAAAGLRRLGLEVRVSALVPVDMMVPAPGQGIVAVECADTASAELQRLLSAVTDADAMTALIAERAVVQALGGDCRMPLGVLATIDGETVSITASVAQLDGQRVVRGTVRGQRGNPAALGETLAAELRAKGAGDILSSATP